METYIGTISLFGTSFVPEGWLPCDGTTYNYSQDSDYQALYTLLGYRFGGQGYNFSVPKLAAPDGTLYAIAYTGTYPPRP